MRFSQDIGIVLAVWMEDSDIPQDIGIILSILIVDSDH